MSYTICSRFKGEHIVYAGYTICTSREHIVYGAFCGSTGLHMSTAYSSLGRTKVLYATSLSTPRIKSQVPAKKTKCQSCFGRYF